MVVACRNNLPALDDDRPQCECHWRLVLQFRCLFSNNNDITHLRGCLDTLKKIKLRLRMHGKNLDGQEQGRQLFGVTNKAMLVSHNNSHKASTWEIFDCSKDNEVNYSRSEIESKFPPRISIQKNHQYEKKIIPSKSPLRLIFDWPAQSNSHQRPPPQVHIPHRTSALSPCKYV